MVCHIALNEEQFRDLVAGREVREVHQSGLVIKIILSDIGFPAIQKAIDDAESQ
jgi:hypothetical protein